MQTTQKFGSARPTTRNSNFADPAQYGWNVCNGIYQLVTSQPFPHNQV
jgi:hypothetical protein